jgi:hypothetical protein
MSYEIATTEPVEYQCRHIFTDGRRCASPTLRSPRGHEPFCYYHHTTRGAASMTPPETSGVPHSRGVSSRVGGGRRSTFTLPLPEDPSSIQHALGQVLQMIASNQLDPRRAGLLLYGLQIASLNLKRNRKPEDNEPETEIVTEITHDPDHGLLAPPAELHANQPIGSAQRLLQELAYDDEPAAPHASQPPQTTPNLTVDLQACAVSGRETIFRMSNFIPKPPSPKLTGLGPRAQKLAALREKAAAQANASSGHAADSASAAKPKNTVAKKTAFQRKAT